jgi:hypothetical protein
MQTLEHTEESASLEQVAPRRRRPFAWALGGVVLLVVAVAATYGLTSTRTVTKTIVKIEPAKTPVTAARNCIPGAGAGSCNTDEFAESQIPDKPLDAATRAKVARQLVTARTAALKYPTVADAVKAGLIQAGKFSPETGAHYISISGALGTFDPANPGSYIYDGIRPSSRIVGLMYLAGSTNPPEGFAGPNDHWHRHSNTCVIFGSQIVVPFAADSSVTKAQCDGVKGTFMRRTTWMVHAWVVPSWESPSGVFSHNNPNLRCADGTIKADKVGFCGGT